MRAFVDLEILRAREDFSAAGERTREGLLARVHPDVVDELVLGLEGTTVARTALPEAGVRRALGPADVLHREVRHDFVHRRKALGARLPRRRLLWFHPHARHLLLDRLAHVAEEGAVVRRRGRRHRRDMLLVRGRHSRVLVHGGEMVVRMVCQGLVMVASRGVMMRLGPRVHVHTQPHLVVMMVYQRRMVMMMVRRMVVVMMVGLV